MEPELLDLPDADPLLLDPLDTLEPETLFLDTPKTKPPLLVPLLPW